MNDIIKFVVSAFMPGELGTKFIRVRKIQFQKVDFPVFKYRLLLVERIPAHTPNFRFNASSTMKLPIKPLAPVIKILSIITFQVLHEY